MVSDLENKMVPKNNSAQVDESKDQYCEETNRFQMKQTSQMIDNNIQVDGNKIEEEYKDENENMQIDMQMEMEEEEEQPSVFNLDARYPEDWNMGEFQVIINHCFDCHKHRTSTKHFEYVNNFLFIFFNLFLFRIMLKNLMKLEIGLRNVFLMQVF